MTDTLTTLRAALEGFLTMRPPADHPRDWNAKYHDAITDLTTLIASMEAQPEPVLYQYRWLNPNNNLDDVGLMDWKLVEPRNPHMGTVQDLIKELEAYRYEGNPVYEVRALYTTAQPSEPKAEPSDDLVVALAEVRDLFPMPEHGSPIEREWASAMADPCSVPDYVRACIAQPKAEPARLTDDAILHLVDTHVGGICPSYPLDNSDWINFAHAIESKIFGEDMSDLSALRGIQGVGL